MKYIKTYNFETGNKQEAIAALLVYAVYRSRDKKRFKVTPEMWGQIERFCKSSAKRSKTIPQFLEQFKAKMSCSSISPKWTEVGVVGRLLKQGDSFIGVNSEESREFLTSIITLEAVHKEVLSCLLKETTWVIALVRDRLELEKNLIKETEIEDESL